MLECYGFTNASDSTLIMQRSLITGNVAKRPANAIEDPEERERTYQELVERMYQHGKALNMASHFEIDDVIDPADTRRWIAAAFTNAPDPGPRQTKKRPYADTW